MKISLAVLALLGTTEGVKLQHHHSSHHNIGGRFVQSDPIHGSLGPPPTRIVEPTPEQKFEAEQRLFKPRTYTDDPDVVDVTANSIKIAETLTKTKFPEPHDVAARKAREDKKKPPLVNWKMQDSDDEDPDTVETRKSLKTAEAALKSRFFTNETDRKKYQAM